MLQPNQRIADFAVQRFVGRGPMSEVYLVRHVIRTTQVAAVKVFTDPRCIRRLMSDADALARSSLLQHSNIVAVIQAAPMAQPPFLVSDFCPGGNLRSLITAKPMDPAEAMAILRQILSALKYAHGMGMAHGNLKPENVLLDDRAVASRFLDEGSVKVSEFGLGRAEIGAILEAGTEIDSAVMNEVAPEVRQGQIPDALADFYSCGVMLFELLTGRVPRPGDLPIHFNRHSPPVLNLVYQQATAPRDRRFKSADEFLAALADLPISTSASEEEIPFDFHAVTAAPKPRATADDTAEIPLRLDASDDVESIELDLAPAHDEVPVEPIHANPPAIAPSIAIGPAPADEHDNTIAFEELPATADDIAAAPAESPLRPLTENANVIEALSINRTATPSSGPAPRPARTVIVDELQRRPLRTVEALRATFNAYFESAPLASSEVGNIRIRIGQWADAQGGDENLAANIEIVRAVTSPMYRIALRTTAAQPGGSPAAPIELGSLLPAAECSTDCAPHLTADDYRTVIQLSTGAFWPDSLQSLELPRLNAAIGELLNDTDQDLGDGTIVRQELLISRAIVIDVQMMYGGSKFNLALAGNGLKVIAAIKPFRRGNPQVLRRVAMALDTPRMPESLSDLRQCLDPDGSPERAEFLLGSLRRRLTQAYLRVANEEAAVSWLESLDLVSRAESLSASEPGIAPHRQRVRKREAMLYLFSGLLIGAIFGVLGAMAKPEVNVPFIAAGGAAFLSGLIAWGVLRTRFRRTLAAFCYALLLPTAIACVIAPAPPKFIGVQGDAICGVILVLIIVANIVLFKKFGNHFFSSHHADPVGNDPDAVLSIIQSYLAQDWAWLEPHYMALGPMTNFVRSSEEPADSANRS